MDVDRIALVLAITLEKPSFSPTMQCLLITAALRQLHDRWPLAGCAVTHPGVGMPRVIAVGRQ